MTHPVLPNEVRLKLELMFEGVRYTEALGIAAQNAFPNFFPYRFQPDEHDPTGTGHATIPYLMSTADGTTVRVKGNGASPWRIEGNGDDFLLIRDEGDPIPVTFDPRPGWMNSATSDGTPMAQTGISLHGDMAVINVAPGCQYFLADRHGGPSLRCSFCTYGAPDSRTAALGQDMASTALPEATYRRMQETLAAAVEDREIHNVYLVGGSMTDWREEGERFITLAGRVQEMLDGKIPISCGSGALPAECQRRLHGEGLVDNVCFNLEIWSQPLFERICPGKQRFVGYETWIDSLETAVGLWGREHVYSAMVAGIELEPEHGLTWEQAADLALEGADALCAKGIIPIYSLYWPLGGRDHPDYLGNLVAYFERLNLGYWDIRQRHGLTIWDGFMTHRSAYMQIECDLDRQNKSGMSV